MGRGDQKGGDQQGYQQRGYQQERQRGRGRGRWKDRDDPRLRRDDSIERRYHAPPSATSINATAFILCLSLYVRKIIEPIKKELQNLECFVKFSKWLSWLFRHGKSLLHDSLSLTLSELFHFREFMQHTNSCLSFIARHDRTHIYGQFDTPEVREHCRNERANFDSMRYFIPFVTVTWLNLDMGMCHFFLVNQKEMVNQKRIGFTPKKTKSKTRSKMNKTYLGDILHGFRPAINLFLRYPESASC